MRLMTWLLTIGFALAGLALRVTPTFAGAFTLGMGCLILAALACPLIWARPSGLMPDALAIPGKSRFMLALALIVAGPLFLPWQLWL